LVVNLIGSFITLNLGPFCIHWWCFGNQFFS